MNPKNLFRKKSTEQGDSDAATAIAKKILRQLVPSSLKNMEFNNEEELSSLGLDSLKYMKFIFLLTEELNKDMEEVLYGIDPAKVQTVGDVVALVERLSATK